MKRIHKAGRRYGLLLVIRRAPRIGRSTRWLCRCDCGNSTTVYDSALSQGRTRSCGCSRHNPSRIVDTIHGRAGPEFSAWGSMIQRCTNPNHPAYHRYGGRGIQVCESWRRSFDKFFADMGPRPTPAYSIGRIDNDGNYESANCWWATKVEQRANQAEGCLGEFVEHRGLRLNLTGWDAQQGFPASTVSKRLCAGWSVEDAIDLPVGEYPPDKLPKGTMTFRGRTKSQRAWAAELEITPVALCLRLKKGWSVERALTTKGRSRTRTRREGPRQTCD